MSFFGFFQGSNVAVKENRERSRSADIVRHSGGDDLAYIMPARRVRISLRRCSAMNSHPVYTHVGCSAYQFCSQLNILKVRCILFMKWRSRHLTLNVQLLREGSSAPSQMSCFRLFWYGGCGNPQATKLKFCYLLYWYKTGKLFGSE